MHLRSHASNLTLVMWEQREKLLDPLPVCLHFTDDKGNFVDTMRDTEDFHLDALNIKLDEVGAADGVQYVVQSLNAAPHFPITRMISRADQRAGRISLWLDIKDAFSGSSTSSLVMHYNSVQHMRIEIQQPVICRIGFIAVNERIGKMRFKLQSCQADVCPQIRDTLQ